MNLRGKFSLALWFQDRSGGRSFSSLRGLPSFLEDDEGEGEEKKEEGDNVVAPLLETVVRVAVTGLVLVGVEKAPEGERGMC